MLDVTFLTLEIGIATQVQQHPSTTEVVQEFVIADF
jgi:hypothetical protein